jgi:hypothetical protein
VKKRQNKEPKTMRRTLLVLTFTTVAGWSQPASQQAPPTAQKAENQPPKPWIHLAELAVPGLVGIAGALIGVFLTNKCNAATFAANRKHELEKLNREHSFTLKRDVLIRLTQSLVQTLAALKDWDNSKDYLAHLEASTGVPPSEMKRTVAETEKAWTEYWLRKNELEQATAAASLAISDELWKSAQTLAALIADARRQSLTGHSSPFEDADKQIAAFIRAARNELGIVLASG